MDVFAKMLSDVLTLSLTAATFVVTVGAVTFAALTYRMKDGIKVRGKFTYQNSNQSKNTFISSVSLYNEKDKAICITGIYLKLSPNIYLTIEDRQQDHMIIGPFETVHLTYQPVVSYSHMITSVDINRLLNPFNPHSQIVLGTPDGKYVVKKSIRMWSPTSESLRTRCSANVTPRRIKIEDQSYGERLRYLVKLELPHYTHTFEIFDYDFRFPFAETCIASEEDLVSPEALFDFLHYSQKSGSLPEGKVKIADGQQAVQKALKFAGTKTYHLHSATIFEVWFRNLKWRIRNWNCLQRIKWRFKYTASLFGRYEGEDS